MSNAVHPQSAVIVAREEAIKIAKSANVDLTDGDLSEAKVCEAFDMAKELGHSKGQLILAELATRLWLRPLTWQGPYYPEFEAFLWAHLAGKTDLAKYITKIMNAAGVEASARQIYSKFLRKMFAASGKTRTKFYADMLADAEIELNLLSVEYGDRARGFHRKVMGSVHREHLLVFYSTGLLLKTLRMGCGNEAPLPKKKELAVLYKYFEENLLLRDKFLDYSKDDSFFVSGMERGTISEL